MLAYSRSRKTRPAPPIRRHFLASGALLSRITSVFEAGWMVSGGQGFSGGEFTHTMETVNITARNTEYIREDQRGLSSGLPRETWAVMLQGPRGAAWRGNTHASVRVSEQAQVLPLAWLLLSLLSWVLFRKEGDSCILSFVLVPPC